MLNQKKVEIFLVKIRKSLAKQFLEVAISNLGIGDLKIACMAYMIILATICKSPIWLGGIQKWQTKSAKHNISNDKSENIGDKFKKSNVFTPKNPGFSHGLHLCFQIYLQGFYFYLLWFYISSSCFSSHLYPMRFVSFIPSSFLICANNNFYHHVFSICSSFISLLYLYVNLIH